MFLATVVKIRRFMFVLMFQSKETLEPVHHFVLVAHVLFCVQAKMISAFAERFMFPYKRKRTTKAIRTNIWTTGIK